MGQFLPPSSRANLSGPYYQNAWNYPLFVQGFPFDYAGRDRGMAFWGMVGGGVFKYQVGLFDLEPGNPVAKLEPTWTAGPSAPGPPSRSGSLQLLYCSNHRTAAVMFGPTTWVQYAICQHLMS